MCPGSPLGCCASTFVDSRCKKGKPCHYPSPIPCYNNVASTHHSINYSKGLSVQDELVVVQTDQNPCSSENQQGMMSCKPISSIYMHIYIYVQFWEWEIMERGSTAATVIASRNSLTLSLVPKKHFCMCQQKILLLPDPGGYLGQRRTPGTSRNSFASQAPKKCGFGSKHKDTKISCFWRTHNPKCRCSQGPVIVFHTLDWKKLCF